MRSVAIQGIHGSYSEEAARKMLGASAELIECGDFISAFEAVMSNRVGCAVVPLRNTIVGKIGEVADLLEKNDVRVLEEFDLQIRHVFAGTASAGIAQTDASARWQTTGEGVGAGLCSRRHR